jgi:uncharacterized protein (TIGR00661 family)
MARILYALSGANRGHTFRTLAVTEELRARGHEVAFCCGGTAREVLEEMGEPVLPVPPLLQTVRDNRVLYWQSLRTNWIRFFDRGAIIGRLRPRIEAFGPDLVLSDYEPYAARAARRLGIPVVTLDHPQIVTRTRYEVPRRFRFEALAARAIIHCIAPPDPVRALVCTFYFPEVEDRRRTTLVGPILRRAVRSARPERGPHALVYFNQPDGSDALLETLSRVRATFVVYNHDPPAGERRWRNLSFRGPSVEGFLEDLANARAVISTAGHTLLTEALYLGKPVLVTPNVGQFEQTLNALYLERLGLGRAVIGRRLEPADIQTFLDGLDSSHPPAARPLECGNDVAVRYVEEALAGPR